MERRHAPTVLAFTRQNVPTLDRSLFAPADGLERGAYILADLGVHGNPDLILMASGSEVGLIVEAGRKLAAQSLAVRLVSFPSWELFAAQEPGIPRQRPAGSDQGQAGSGSGRLDGLGTLGRRKRQRDCRRPLRRLGSVRKLFIASLA